MRMKAAVAVAGVLVLVMASFAVFERRQQLSTFVWERFHVAAVATFLYPHDAALQEEMGNYYFSTEHYDVRAARAHFKRAVAIDPAVPLAHYQLGRIYFIQGQYARALSELNAQLALNPDFMRTYYMLGLVHAYSGDMDPAVKDFTTFLEWKPESWAANNDLAWVYFMQGEYARTLEQADVGLNYNPGNMWLLTMRGVALLNLGRKAEAKDAFTAALAGAQKLTPADWSAAYPGNDPSIAAAALAEMKRAIEKNLALAQ